MHRFSIGITACLSLALCGGCATGITGGDKLLKFHINDDSSFAAAPRDGKYIVAYRQEGSGELWQAPGTRRKLSKGDAGGFAHDDQGRVVAIAGKYEKT